jgi:hypothetical protein
MDDGAVLPGLLSKFLDLAAFGLVLERVGLWYSRTSADSAASWERMT